jgi:oligopeptide transport system permease protein
VAGGIMALFLIVAGLSAPLVSPHSPESQDYDSILASPSADHPLGADRLGRDTLSRLLHGARTSLAVGVLVQVVVLAIGLPVGLVAGFASPRVDNPADARSGYGLRLPGLVADHPVALDIGR